MASTAVRDVDIETRIVNEKADAGAIFVLESKGNWSHAGYHLTTSIVAPALLSLPWAFAGLGWAAGLTLLTVGALVTFYSYNLISQVLEHMDSQGKRLLRFRDLAHHVLGPRWARYGVTPVQFVVCFGAVIGCILLGGQSLKALYIINNPEGKIKLSEFIAIFGVVMLLLSQLPSFHSLRHINLISLLLCLTYSTLAVVGCIHAGKSDKGGSKDYSIAGSKVSKAFGAINSMSVIATTFGNGIIPEIQGTLSSPVSGKMFKGLCICYAVVVPTFLSVAVSGYWAFGNAAEGVILSNLAPSGEPLLVSKGLIFSTYLCVLLQLFAVALVYCQPTFEVLEGRFADVDRGRFSMRNLVPRVVLRSLYVVCATVIAAMVPFFGDVNAVIGAFGFIPLDFILPVVLYNVTFKPSKTSVRFWINSLIGVTFTLVEIVGCVAAIRQIALDAIRQTALDANTYKLFANV